MDERANQVALITGGAVGAGRAIAEELARRGWSVFIQHNVNDGREDQAAAAAEEAACQCDLAIRAVAGVGDLSDADDRERLIDQANEAFGRIDMLVNAAQPVMAGEGDILELTEDELQQAIQTQLAGPVMFSQLIANDMVRLVEAGELENPRIVTLNSFSAYTTGTDHAGACFASAGLAMLTRLLADRLGEFGIGVYEVRGGIIAGGPDDPAHAAYGPLIAEGLTPIRRWGRVEDLARAVAAIAEGLLGYSTGEVINVDGGFHLRRL